MGVQQVIGYILRVWTSFRIKMDSKRKPFMAA
jgi:hypothetical protein